jgi:hypothetical protein
VLGDPGAVPIEALVQRPQRVLFGIVVARVGCAQALGIGVHAHHLLPHGLGVVAEEDCVAQRLAHLEEAPIGPGRAQAHQALHPAACLLAMMK